METLQDLRKRKYKTIKAFSEAIGFSASKGSLLLKGAYCSTFTREEVQLLADVLGVTFEVAVQAVDALSPNDRKSLEA